MAALPNINLECIQRASQNYGLVSNTESALILIGVSP